MLKRIVAGFIEKFEQLFKEEEKLLLQAAHARNTLIDIKITILALGYIIVLLVLIVVAVHVLRFAGFDSINLKWFVLSGTSLVYFVLVYKRVKKRPLGGLYK